MNGFIQFFLPAPRDEDESALLDKASGRRQPHDARAARLVGQARELVRVPARRQRAERMQEHELRAVALCQLVCFELKGHRPAQL